MMSAVRTPERRAFAAWPHDRQLRIDTNDVLDRGVFEIEDGRVLAQIGDLDHGTRAAVVDQERLVALAPEVGRRALDAEDLGGDVRHLFRREARRLRLEDGHEIDPTASRTGRSRAAPGSHCRRRPRSTAP